MDIAALVDAGLPRGRATRILRHSHGEHGMAILATSDTRAVYKDLLERACEYAITEHARDRIRVVTPLTSTDAMEDRLDDVTLVTEIWTDIDDPTCEAVLEVFARFEETGGGERAAVETVRQLQEAGVSTGVFDRIAAIDTDALEDAARALGSLDTGVGTDPTKRPSVRASTMNSIRSASNATRPSSSKPPDLMSLRPSSPGRSTAARNFGRLSSASRSGRRSQSRRGSLILPSCFGGRCIGLLAERNVDHEVIEPHHRAFRLSLLGEADHAK